MFFKSPIGYAGNMFSTIHLFDSTGFSDLEGGAYLGLGVGYEMGSIVIGGTYVISDLKVKAVSGTIDVDIIATMLNVTVGYKF